MALKKFGINKGLNLQPQATLSNSAKGDLEVDNSTGKLHYHDGSSDSILISASGTDALTNKTINADLNTITNIDNNEIKAAAAIDLTKLAATTVSRALVSDASGFVSPATTTAVEIGYVNGVTSAIQTQLNAKQASGSYITALTGDVTATGPGSVAATIVANAVTNAKAAQMPTLTLKGNNTGGTANALDLTVSQVNTMLGSLSNPMTTAGDIIYGGTSGVVTRLAQGIKGQPLVTQAGGTNIPGYSWGSTNAVSSAGYTVLDTDGYTTIAVSTGAVDRTIVLPLLANNQNRAIRVVKTDTGVGKVIVDANGAELINDTTEYYLLKQNDTALFTAYSANWIADKPEKIFASYTSSVAGTVGTGNGTIQVYGTAVEDVRAFYNSSTGLITFPRAGLFNLQFSVFFSGVSTSSGQYQYSFLINSNTLTSVIAYGQQIPGNSAASVRTSILNYTVRVTKGQTMSFAAFSPVATTRDGNPMTNFMTINSIDS